MNFEKKKNYLGNNGIQQENNNRVQESKRR